MLVLDTSRTSPIAMVIVCVLCEYVKDMSHESVWDSLAKFVWVPSMYALSVEMSLRIVFGM